MEAHNGAMVPKALANALGSIAAHYTATASVRPATGSLTRTPPPIYLTNEIHDGRPVQCLSIGNESIPWGRSTQRETVIASYRFEQPQVRTNTHRRSSRTTRQRWRPERSAHRQDQPQSRRRKQFVLAATDRSRFRLQHRSRASPNPEMTWWRERPWSLGPSPIEMWTFVASKIVALVLYCFADDLL
jgi:hypothetical protein